MIFEKSKILCLRCENFQKNFFQKKHKIFTFFWAEHFQGLFEKRLRRIKMAQMGLKGQFGYEIKTIPKKFEKFFVFKKIEKNKVERSVEAHPK